MKRIIRLFFFSAAIFLTCNCEQIEEFDAKLKDLDSRVTALETQLAQLNDQVSLVQKLLSENYFVQSVVKTDNPDGYKLVLVDNENLNASRDE